jgi:hypothetical protein
MDIAGHVSRQMLKHYSHIRMQAKRDALESVVSTPSSSSLEISMAVKDCDPALIKSHGSEGMSLQKSLQSNEVEAVRSQKKRAKLLKRIGSSGRIRTYNPSVNSRMLYR